LGLPRASAALAGRLRCGWVSGPRARSITIETGQSDRESNMWRFAHEALALLKEVLRSPAD
jgi:hypothetical protein